MKMLIQTLLLALLAGCASPYYPVYVSGDGDYYIAERAASGPYYGTGSMPLVDIGMYPWWISGYPPSTFVYYSPNFYPHYFSVWYPPGFHPHYGYYGGYFADWCPPYRIRRQRVHGLEDEVVGSPVLPPVAASAQPVVNPVLWRSVDRAGMSRDIMNRHTVVRKATPSTRPASPYTRTAMPSSVKTAPAGSFRPAGISRSSSRSVSTLRSTRESSRLPALHDQ